MNIIGIVTFGGLDFTKLCVRAIIETTTKPFEIVAVVGKPGDFATEDWLKQNGIRHVTHTINRGFPSSLNDIVDCFMDGGHENLILCGNDVIPYPGAIDAMITAAETTDLEWVAASQFDVQGLVSTYPETAALFSGPNFNLIDFNSRPWEIHNPVVATAVANPYTDLNPEGPSLIKDVQNLCLYRRSVFEKLGYFDSNFWPNGYFSDNDYARRGVNAKVRSGALRHAQYFHFWSRTVHQGESRPNDRYFARNSDFYNLKWGGPFAQEQRTFPEGSLEDPGTLKISSRDGERAVIDRWSSI